MSTTVPSPGRRATTIVVVDRAGRETVVARVDARRPDLALVDRLARLQLDARRRGGAVRIDAATDALRGLLELVGLAEVLALEAGRQPELGEHVGVEEVVQPGDPPA